MTDQGKKKNSKEVEMKKYKVPQEIIDLFDEGNSAEACRNHAAESLFFSGRAIAYGKKAIKARRKAWELVYEIYPELEGKTVTFHHHECEVVLRKP